MKIERYLPEHLPVSTTVARPSRLPDKTQAPNQSYKTDRADISVASRSISYLVQQVLLYPEIREELIRELQEKIASGTYTVPYDRVAEAILREKE